MEEKKYEVEVLEKGGTCDTKLFEKMATKGDISSNSIKNFIDKVLTIVGYSICHIETNEKSFNIGYFDTEEYGYISTGSEIFYESVKDYFGEVEQVRIVEIKTKQGITYKAMPVIGKKKEETQKNEKEETTNNDELPF